RRAHTPRASMSRASNGSDAAIVQAVGPTTAIPGADVVVAGDELHRADPLHHLVPALTLQAQSQRRAIGRGQWLPVHVVGEERLRCTSEIEIDDAVVLPVAWLFPLFVEGAKENVPSRRPWSA